MASGEGNPLVWVGAERSPLVVAACSLAEQASNRGVAGANHMMGGMCSNHVGLINTKNGIFPAKSAENCAKLVGSGETTSRSPGISPGYGLIFPSETSMNEVRDESWPKCPMN